MKWKNRYMCKNNYTWKFISFAKQREQKIWLHCNEPRQKKKITNLNNAHNIGDIFPLFKQYFYNRKKLRDFSQRCVWFFLPALIKNRGTKMCFAQTQRSLWGSISRLQVGSVTENRWWTCAAAQPQTLTFLTGSTSPSSKDSPLSSPPFCSTTRSICMSSCVKKNRRRRKEAADIAFLYVASPLIICRINIFKPCDVTERRRRRRRRQDGRGRRHGGAWERSQNETESVTTRDDRPYFRPEWRLLCERTQDRGRREGFGGVGGVSKKFRTTQNLRTAHRSSQGKPKTHR